MSLTTVFTSRRVSSLCVGLNERLFTQVLRIRIRQIRFFYTNPEPKYPDLYSIFYYGSADPLKRKNHGSSVLLFKTQSDVSINRFVSSSKFLESISEVQILNCIQKDRFDVLNFGTLPSKPYLSHIFTIKKLIPIRT